MIFWVLLTIVVIYSMLVMAELILDLRRGHREKSIGKGLRGPYETGERWRRS